MFDCRPEWRPTNYGTATSPPLQRLSHAVGAVQSTAALAAGGIHARTSYANATALHMQIVSSGSRFVFERASFIEKIQGSNL